MKYHFERSKHFQNDYQKWRMLISRKERFNLHRFTFCGNIKIKDVQKKERKIWMRVLIDVSENNTRKNT